MAQRVQVVLVDDLDGGDATETVNFSIDNVAYEIDLNAGNAAKLREAFAEWTPKARRVSSAKRGGGRPRRADSAKVRAWAKDNGFEISERGRISTEIREAYAAAK